MATLLKETFNQSFTQLDAFRQLPDTPDLETLEELDHQDAEAQQSSGNFQFTRVENHYMLVTAIDQCDNHGMRAVGGFKKQLFVAVANAVSAIATLPWRKARITPASIKTKLATWQSEWTAWHELLSHSDFAIDPETGCPTAAEEVQKAYFAIHPKAEKFIRKPLPWLAELDLLFGDTVATGKHVLSVQALLQRLVPPTSTRQTPISSSPGLLTPEFNEIRARKRVIYDASAKAKRRRVASQRDEVNSGIEGLIEAMFKTAAMTALPLPPARAISRLVFSDTFMAGNDEIARLTIRQKTLLCRKILAAEDGEISEIFLGAPLDAQQEMAMAILAEFEYDFDLLS